MQRVTHTGRAAYRINLAGATGDPPGALGRIRTCDTRFRKPVLYPLSYEGGC